MCGCGCVGLCVKGGGLLIAQNSAMFAQPVIRRAQVVTPKKPSRYARVERKPTEPANVTTATQLFGNFGAAVESVSNLLQDQLDVLQTMFVTPMVSQVEVAQAVNVRPRACFGLAWWLALAASHGFPWLLVLCAVRVVASRRHHWESPRSTQRPRCEEAQLRRRSCERQGRCVS